MISNDYRTTKYCDSFGCIEDKKKLFEKNIRKTHPRAENLYEYIYPNDGQFKKPFMEIYNYKCAYCGVSIDIIPITSFEIDHIEAKSRFPSETKAGHMDNLALACRDCNRKKSDSLEIQPQIHPDLLLGTTFYRDELFNIKISNDYLNDPIACEFYDCLKLGSNLRRLDYILINLCGIKRAYKEKYNTDLQNISDAIDIIRKKRNISVL